MLLLHVLWDESHIWGLLLIRALKAWKLPYRLLRGEDIAQGALAKQPAALLVPGGRAKSKAEVLGLAGFKAVRAYINGGGTYIGFCGGAGLGLSKSGGLDLCPWGRGKLNNQLEHFLSGNVHLKLARNHTLVPFNLDSTILAPVWWPAQFDPQNDNTEVLASYQGPGQDFWVADLNLSSIPEEVHREWEQLYGIHLKPKDLVGRPAVITGRLGKGRYVLSYPHLETPDSYQANVWLAHILEFVLHDKVPNIPLPAWDLTTQIVIWHDPTLLRAAEIFEDIIRTGREHFLLFWRNTWLLGWRRGIPGSAIDSIYALTKECLAVPETEAARKFWQDKSPEFSCLSEIFHQAAIGYLLAEHLAITILHSRTESLHFHTLKNQREVLFGSPPNTGGLHARLLRLLEILYWHLSI